MALMVATEPRLAIVWDEGYTLGREARIRDWFKAMANPKGFAATWVPPSPRSELVQVRPGDPSPPGRDEIDSRAKLLSPNVIAWFWPFAREEPHGHPPFYAIEGLIGDWLAPSWPVLSRARLGPMLAFSLTGGAIFGFIARRWGPWAGALAAASWVFQPNLFGHGHYATVDALLTSLWVGACLAFAGAVEREGGPLDGGGRSLRGALRMGGRHQADGLVPAPAVLRVVAAVPISTRMADPARRRPGGGGRAVRVQPLLVGRAGLRPRAVLPLEPHPRQDDPDPGRVPGAGLRHAQGVLPWYNTVVWTVLVTPVGFLVFGLVGAGSGLVEGLASAAGGASPHPNPPPQGGRGPEFGSVRLRPEATSPLGPFAALATLHWASCSP